MTSASVDPLLGRTLDERYVVRSRIARGGMAVVYLGDDLRLGRRIALKIMHAHLAEDESFTRRFEQEARSAAGLGHPNVVNVFDQGEDNGVPYLVMEYLPGITLRELLKRQTLLTPAQATQVGEAVLAGLAAAHSAGIVHRDLKPENVLLADDGRIKIGDFGLARAVSAHTTTGQALLGTIAYLSPELVTRGIADARSDLYAFGIMLFEMLTGKQPYAGEQPMQIAYQHAHSDVPLPSTLIPDLPPALDQLVHWTTQRDPAARPADAREAFDFMRGNRAQSNFAATTALPTASAPTASTPSTAVLGHTELHDLAADPKAAPAPTAPPSAVGRAQAAASARATRGRWVAACIVLLLILSGGAGWWWGQGPGSMVTVPEVVGLDMSAADQALTEASLEVAHFECSSLEITQGLAVRTEPESGARVQRGGTVRLCESTGPEMLPVPQLVGLQLDEAKAELETAGFVSGEVLQERFDDGEKGEVILAVDSEGEGLGDTFPEQGVIDFIVSAGSVPSVQGLSVEQATKALTDAGLKVDASKTSEEHSESVETGKVISVVTSKKTLRVGNTVGLKLSLGPELFSVPDVSGKSMRDAINDLKDAGFDPTTSVPEVFWGAVQASGTDPEAGEMVEKGTKITVLFNA